MPILAADIGGTSTRLRLVHGVETLDEKDYSSQDYPDLNSILEHFIKANSPVDLQTACLAIAGPVRDGKARVTNLPWQVHESRIREDFAIPQVRIINDFEAIGYALAILQPDDFYELQAGSPDSVGTRALIGAGTGLGVAIVTRCGERWQVLPGEGGHVDFAPRTTEQQALLDYLQEQNARVSVEMLLSGPGLERIYEFICTQNGLDPSSARRTAASISSTALLGRDPLAVKTLDMFVEIFGAQAGNLALTSLATGGVFIAGGIAPKILSVLKRGDFIEKFSDKPPMSELLRSMPVRVVLNTRSGLLGAVQVASELANTST
ncbi:MAG: glucokinase [Gammaproteobacteria bacterium]|nr:glucokinase [Gammaproteobacteria bacterium]